MELISYNRFGIDMEIKVTDCYGRAETVAKAEAKEKFVAYIDILGFKSPVENSGAGTGLSQTQIIKILQSFGSMKETILTDAT
jgi:hypothetical protein